MCKKEDYIVLFFTFNYGVKFVTHFSILSLISWFPLRPLPETVVNQNCQKCRPLPEIYCKDAGYPLQHNTLLLNHRLLRNILYYFIIIFYSFFFC